MDFLVKEVWTLKLTKSNDICWTWLISLFVPSVRTWKLTKSPIRVVGLGGRMIVGGHLVQGVYIYCVSMGDSTWTIYLLSSCQNGLFKGCSSFTSPILGESVWRTVHSLLENPGDFPLLCRGKSMGFLPGPREPHSLVKKRVRWMGHPPSRGTSLFYKEGGQMGLPLVKRGFPLLGRPSPISRGWSEGGCPTPGELGGGGVGLDKWRFHILPEQGVLRTRKKYPILRAVDWHHKNFCEKTREKCPAEKFKENADHFYKMPTNSFVPRQKFKKSADHFLKCRPVLWMPTTYFKFDGTNADHFAIADHSFLLSAKMDVQICGFLPTILRNWTFDFADHFCIKADLPTNRCNIGFFVDHWPTLWCHMGCRALYST